MKLLVSTLQLVLVVALFWGLPCWITYRYGKKSGRIEEIERQAKIAETLRLASGRDAPRGALPRGESPPTASGS
jgi:hypothetical protein